MLPSWVSGVGVADQIGFEAPWPGWPARRVFSETFDIQTVGLPPKFTLDPSKAAGEPVMVDINDGHHLRVWPKIPQLQTS
jgi:hypothetical protein